MINYNTVVMMASVQALSYVVERLSPLEEGFCDAHRLLDLVESPRGDGFGGKLSLSDRIAITEGSFEMMCGMMAEADPVEIV